MVWVILFGVTIETEVPIRYVLKMGDGDFFACDEYDGVSFFTDAGNSLGQTVKFSGVRLDLKFFVLLFDKDVSHLQERAGVHVKNCIESQRGMWDELRSWV